MPGLRRAEEARSSDHETSRWRDEYAPERRATPSRGWLLAGAAVLVLGGLAWYHFGSDLKRYIKMERM